MQTNKEVNTSFNLDDNRFNQNLVTSIGLMLFVIVVLSVFFGNYLSNSRIPKFNTIENAKLNLSFYHLDLENKSSLSLNTKKKPNAFKQAQIDFKQLLKNKSWDNYFYPTFTKPQILTVNQIIKQLKQNELFYKNKQNLRGNIAKYQADFDALINKISDFQVSLYQRHFKLIQNFRVIQLILFLIFLIYIIVFFFLFKKYRKKNSNLISNQEQVLQELERKNYFLKKSQFIANIGYYYYDFKTKLWTASEFILKLINYNEGKYPLDMWVNIIHPDDRTILTDVLKKRLYNPNIALDVTYRIINPKNGKIYWMHHFAQAIERDKNGENLPIVGIVQDITLQKENDVRLNRFNQIMESTLNEIYIVDYKNLNFIEVNEAVLFNLNYTKPEILELKLTDIAPAMSPEKIEELRLKLTTKKTVIFETYYKRKDGSTYPVEVHIQKGKQGDVNVFFIIVLDTSERDTTLKKLEDSDNRWKFAIEGTNDGLWDMNYKTSEIYYSKRWKEMLGYTDHELPNTVETWRKLVHPDDIERVEFTSHLHFDNKTPNYASEYRMLCKDGSYKWILDRGKVVERDKAGKPVRVIGVHTDISERKALEKSLFQKSQMLSKHMNHTPLAAIYTDTNSIIKEWNKAAEDMFGYPEEEAIGKNLIDLIVTNNDKTDVKIICDELLSEKGGNISYNDNQSKDGSILNCIWYNTLIKDEKDKPIGFASLVENITKQNALEETIKQIEKTISFKTGKDYYEALTKELNKALQADYLFIGKNNDNETVTTISSLNNQKILPNITYDLKNTPCELLLNSDYCSINQNVTEQFKLDEDLKKLNIEAYLGVAIYNGKKQFIGNLVAMYCKPIKEFTHFKSLMRIVANKIGTEIERNNLVEALYANQRELQSAQQIAKLGSYNLNLVNYKATVSETFNKITGFNIETNQIDFKKDWRSIVFDEDIEGNQKMLENCLKTGADFNREYRILTNDTKELKWVHGLGHVIYKDNEPINFVGTILDITEKRKLERNFIQAFIEAQEQEKQNFGEDLHDGLGQILTAESMYIDLLLDMNNDKDGKTNEFLSKIKELNLSAIYDTRSIAHGLMSTQLKEKGLIMAIDQICKDYNNSKNIQFSFEHSGLEEDEIAAEIKTQLYRITQEISTNIVRHSDATEASISLNKINSNQIELTVKDNGIGMNMDKIKTEKKGAGIVNIKRRVKLLNGTATINTAENKGTQYNIIVPLVDI